MAKILIYLYPKTMNKLSGLKYIMEKNPQKNIFNRKTKIIATSKEE